MLTKALGFTGVRGLGVVQLATADQDTLKDISSEAAIKADLLRVTEVSESASVTHIARLEKLRDEGRLLLSGPLPAIDSEDPGPAGFTGSLIVAEFDSLEAARAWGGEDPYVAAGIYATIDVQPFRKTLP